MYVFALRHTVFEQHSLQAHNDLCFWSLLQVSVSLSRFDYILACPQIKQRLYLPVPLSHIIILVTSSPATISNNDCTCLYPPLWLHLHLSQHQTVTVLVCPPPLWLHPHLSHRQAVTICICPPPPPPTPTSRHCQFGHILTCPNVPMSRHCHFGCIKTSLSTKQRLLVVVPPESSTPAWLHHNQSRLQAATGGYFLSNVTESSTPAWLHHNQSRLQAATGGYLLACVTESSTPTWLHHSLSKLQAETSRWSVPLSRHCHFGYTITSPSCKE